MSDRIGLAFLASTWRASLALVVLLSPASAQTLKLNGPLAQTGAADVLEDFTFSPDGAHMLYRADRPRDGSFNLFSAPADASAAPVQLSEQLRVGMGQFGFTPGPRVLFLGDPNLSFRYELFSVPIDGSAGPTRLSPDLSENLWLSSFRITPDGTRALFVDALRIPTLYTVPIDGSAAAHRLEPSGGDVRNYWITPDSAFVLVAMTLPDGRERLYRIPVDASAEGIELATTTPSILGRSGIYSLEFTPDGRRALFLEGERKKFTPDRSRLFSIPLDGSQAPTPFSQAPQPFLLPFRVGQDGRVVFSESGELRSAAADGTQPAGLTPPGWTATGQFELTLDGRSVVFVVLRDTPQGQERTLFRAPIEGGNATQLLAPLPRLIVRILVTDSRVLYSLHDTQAMPFRGLYSLALSGSEPPVLLNGPPVPGGVFPFPGAFRPVPGREEVVFLDARGSEGRFELFLAPLDGSLPARRLHEPPDFARDVTAFQLAADGEHVAFLSDQRNDETFELYRASLHGAPEPRRYVNLPGGPITGDVTGFRASAAGDVLYRADQAADQAFALYRVSVEDRPEPTLLAPLYAASEIFELSASDSHAVFHAGALYSARSAPGAPAILLDASSGAPSALVISPDESWVVYRRRRGFSGDQDLTSVPIDGETPPLLLHPPVPAGRTVSAFQVSPDSRFVVFRADHGRDETFELYRVSIDGRGGAVRLSAELGGSSDVRGFQISPAGGWVAYIADEQFTVDELFSVPLDRSCPPRRLNGPLPMGGDVLDFVFSPDGSRVVYRADEAANSRFNLFSASVEGRSASQLTFLSDENSVEPDYRVSLEGKSVLYRANPGGSVELFRVPIDGSAAPTRLNGGLVGGGNVDSFALSPDKRRLVYLADQESDEVFELFSLALLAAAPVLRLDPLPGFADVDTYRIEPDSAAVVYRVDRKEDRVFELFWAALDGRTPPERLNQRLAPGGDVAPDFVALPGGRVIYRADQEQDEVDELFLGRVAPRLR